MSIELEKLERSTDLCAQPRPKLRSATECRKINKFFLYNERTAVANSNVNGRSKKTAIHLAVESLDTYAIKGLIGSEEININVKDDDGNTPLHLAVKFNHSDIVEILLKRPDLDINDVNENGQTPLHLALDHNDQKIAYLLLTKDGIDIDTPNPKYNEKSCREIIQEKFPEMYLITLLRNGEIDEFIASVKKNHYFLDGDDNSGYTYYLEYACENGLKEVVETLLNLDVPNKCSDENIIILLKLAAFKGYYKILELLLKHLNTSLKEMNEGVLTVFHVLLTGAKESEYLHRTDENCDHKQCLKLLLSEKDVLSKMNRILDNDGKTILDRAACLNDDDFVKMILRPPLYIGMKNTKGKYSFMMTKSRIIEESLNSCIYTNDVMDSLNENYAIIFDFGMLIPIADRNGVNGILGTDPIFMKKLVNVHLGNGERLLEHPLLMSFISSKWDDIFPSFFIKFLIWFVIIPTYSVLINSTIIFHYSSDHIFNSIAHVFINFFASVFVLGFMIIKHAFQDRYMDENITSCKKWMKIGIKCIVISFFVVSPLLISEKYYSCNGLLFVLLIIANSISLTPVIADYFIVFKIVSKRFFVLFFSFFPLIVMFSGIFYKIYGEVPSSKENPNYFHIPELSIFKTFVMMFGEFDLESIPTKPNSYLSYGHLVLWLFFFFVSIVLFSSFNGLAVSDIQAIAKAKAKFSGNISKINQIAFSEFCGFGKKQTKLATQIIDTKLYVYPNRNKSVIRNCPDCSFDINDPPEFLFHQNNTTLLHPKAIMDSMIIIEIRKQQHKEASFEDLFKEFHHKTEEQFKNEYLPKLDKFESKLDIFQNEYSQKFDQFESKLDTFRNEYSEKIDHFNTNITKILKILEHKL